MTGPMGWRERRGRGRGGVGTPTWCLLGGLLALPACRHQDGVWAVGRRAPPVVLGGAHPAAVDPAGEMDCPAPTMPCNHRIMLAVGGAGDPWTILPEPLAIRASVPGVTVVPHGVIDGEMWTSLWITYVDAFAGNIDDPTAEHVLTTASVAFPVAMAASASGLTEILTGDGPRPWVYRRLRLPPALGPALVDPDRDLVLTRGGPRHLLALTQVARPTPGEAPARTVIVLVADDPFDFVDADIYRLAVDGTDPDLHPVGWTGAYPGPLPARYAPGGRGAWALHLADGPSFRRFETDLYSVVDTGERVEGLTVVSTRMSHGELQVFGHASVDDGTPAERASVARVVRGPAGFGPVEVVLPAEAPALAPYGAYSPASAQVGVDTEVLVFHTRMDSGLAD